MTIKYDLEPLRQGDLDGLCGVYSVLNATQWLVPKARDVDYLTKLFGHIIGDLYKLENIRDGGEEPELKSVFEYVRGQIKSDFKVNLGRVGWVENETIFEVPDDCMYEYFENPQIYQKGVFIFGFDGFDSHWTVARGVTRDEVLLFDSWKYHTFPRDKFIWKKNAKKKFSKIAVEPRDLNWVWAE